MKVFHTGDIHMCAKHREWVNRAMEHATDSAISQKCDIAVIAGDSFDHAINAHEPAFADFVGHVVRLSNYMPVVLLYGTASHDRPGCLDAFKLMPSRHAIHVIDKPTQFELCGAMVSALPSLNKAEIEEGCSARDWTSKQLASFAPSNIAARANGQPTFLITHGTINGSTTESRYALVSPDHEMDVQALANADADAVMINHIHAHQSWPNVLTPSGARTTIAYSGSIARLVHGHHNPVGFLIWNIEPGKARFTFHPTPARQLLEITFDGPPNMAELRELARTVTPDDAVRIRWSVDEEHVTAIDKAAIRELFAGAETLKLEGRVLPVQRTRAGGIGQALTLADKLSIWAKATGSDGIERLLERLELVQGHDPERIVSRIVDEPADALRESA